ncbi:MAG: phosphate ABC transporter permease subunit PstC [Solirubrobacteraceae bacterium]|nr:phosphate ABC transporter permease subunit PstC [Solirubrobacteraceae bacterium]
MAVQVPAPPARGPAWIASLREPWSDRRTELVLGAAACFVVALIIGMVAFVFAKAWPSFSANGLAWFGDTGNVNQQLDQILQPGTEEPVRKFGAFDLLWGTVLTTGGAVMFGVVFSTLAAVFMVEFAPERLRNLLTPTVSLLAAVPSVIYGLIGILVLAPFVANFISQERKESVSGVISLTGENWLLATLILALMIVPIMTAITAQALRQVPRAWTEGAAALGVNRWRVMWTISVRAARPAIIAGTVLATARALGEAIMLAMVAGGSAFAPNPADGTTFFFEPTRTLAAEIVYYREGLANPALASTLYAIAGVLLVSAMALSIGAYVAKQPLKKYGIRT